MKKSFYLAMLPASLLLAACSHDSDYFVHHPEEMGKKLQSCMMLPKKEAEADAECMAAAQAMNQAMNNAMENALGGDKKK